MNFASEIYQKNKIILTVYLFPGILFVYPFLTVNQGVDVSDSLYSLTNFRFFPQMEGMWIVSTYLSNVIGYLLTKLPFGTTVLGMKFYTGLVVSIIVLFAYSMLKRWMPAWIAFLGEIIAISYCWIPTTILYNYLTYCFLTIGVLFLYKGLVEEKKILLVLSGLFLGVNAWVRIPNITEMALILSLWYYLAIKKIQINEIIAKTFYCVVGYLLGFLLPSVAILLQYGLSGLREMIFGLGNVGNRDETYTVLGMILSTVKAYGRSLKWVTLILVVIVMGTAMFFSLKESWEKFQKVSYVLGIVILLRFLWGRGMFTFRYYEDYTSIYEWGMIALFLSWVGSVIMLCFMKSSAEEKLWSVLVMLILVITPLGSNNYTYQNMNNLFLTAPVGLYIYVRLLRKKEKNRILAKISFPWKAMVVVLGGVIIFQGIGFHSKFVFRDGMRGEKRDYVFHTPAVVAGMKTTKENGQELQEVLDKLEQCGENKILLFGDCPGISFLSGKAPAIYTAWPDLESESYEKIEQDIYSLTSYPVVVLREKEYNTEQTDEKKDLIESFVEKNHYQLIYEGKTYQIFKK